MFLFNSSRSSLYHVLICNYEKFKNKKILIPAYTCHTVVDTIIRAKISYEYYNIGLDLSINFQQIKSKLLSGNFFAILSTNYFGFPYYIEEFKKLAKEHRIFLFEDNSHGLGSYYKGLSLGQNGDFAFTSLTKHLRLQSGSILHIKKNLLSSKIKDCYYVLENESINFNKFVKSLFSLKFSKTYNFFSSKKSKKLSLDDPYLYRDDNFSHAKIDKYSKYLFSNLNIEKLKKNKIENYKYWQELIYKNFNITPIYKINENINPWCVAYIIKDIRIKREIINFLKNTNAICYSWPTLHTELINSKSEALDLWKTILCISTSSK